MENLVDSISLISVLAGIISILATVITSIFNKYVQLKSLNKLKNEQLQYILESSDIVSLGNYLDQEIGQLSISDYVDNKDLTKRVNLLLNKLTRFVGSEEKIKAQSEEEDSMNPSLERIQSFPFNGKLGDEFDNILNELYTGEAWNALARLRRYIEIFLREIAYKRGLKVNRIYSLSQLIDALKHAQIIDSDVAANLKFPVHVSNRAVHGQELKEGEAEEAIYHAAYSLDRIINSEPNK